MPTDPSTEALSTTPEAMALGFSGDSPSTLNGHAQEEDTSVNGNQFHLFQVFLFFFSFEMSPYLHCHFHPPLPFFSLDYLFLVFHSETFVSIVLSMYPINVYNVHNYD